jgi:hypothetical protein
MSKKNRNTAQVVESQVETTEAPATTEAPVATETTEQLVTTESAVAEAAPQTSEQKMIALDEKHGKVKSKMIRELHADGIATKEIVKLMKLVYPNFIYQHARNVLNQQIKKTS